MERVATTALEIDERTSEVVRKFFPAIQNESGFKELDENAKKEALLLFDKIKGMKFKSLRDFTEVLTALLKDKAPGLVNYTPIALDKAKSGLSDDNKGVLVIYTGGTIGSAPKDEDDPDSPQVVKPWEDLKSAIPNLDRLGFRIDAVSFEEPLDSCNVGPRHWLTMADIIFKYYRDYEGFVILHGTDTMVYSASALSLILQELGKPVIITGSQIAGIVEVRNDAHQNFITSLYLANPKIAKIPAIPEVCICFGGNIIRGNRSKKGDAAGFEGFVSPNYPLLGLAQDNIDIDPSRIRPLPDNEQPEMFSNLDTSVISIDVFPGIQHSKVIQKLLDDPELKGVILRSYGTGNIPTDKEFLTPLEEFSERGVVVNITQCQSGSVEMGLYETSQVLIDRGVISGYDLTQEAAMCKLMVLLGQYGDDLDAVRDMMQLNLAGEQELSLYSTRFPAPGAISPETPRFDIPASNLNSVGDPAQIHKAMLRFHNARLEPGIEGDDPRLPVMLFVDAPGGSLDPKSDRCAGVFRKPKTPAGILVDAAKGGESLAFDVTPAKESLFLRERSSKMAGKQKISFTVAMDRDKGSFSWDKVTLEIYVKES